MSQQRSCCVLQYHYRPLHYNKEEHAAQVSNIRTAPAGLYVSIMDSNTIGDAGSKEPLRASVLQSTALLHQRRACCTGLERRTALAGLYVSIMDCNTIGIVGQDTCHKCADRVPSEAMTSRQRIMRSSDPRICTGVWL